MPRESDEHDEERPMPKERYKSRTLFAKKNIAVVNRKNERTGKGKEDAMKKCMTI
jgi:hypothetical protein